MVNGIGCAHKLSKQNSQQFGVTHGTLIKTASTYYNNDKFNEIVYLGSKESITIEKNAILSHYLIHLTYDLIHAKPVYTPNITNILNTGGTVDE